MDIDECYPIWMDFPNMDTATYNWYQLRILFGQEKWSTDAEKREKLKTERQNSLDEKLYYACQAKAKGPPQLLFTDTREKLYDVNRAAKELKVMGLLMEGATNDSTDSGRSALHEACANGSFDIVKKIYNFYPEEIHRRAYYWYHYTTPLANDAVFIARTHFCTTNLGIW